MRRAAALLALIGVAVATALLAREGFVAVLGAFAAAGVGVVWSSLFHLVSMGLNARAWQLLLPRGRGSSLPFVGWLVWVREAVNGLLPVARVGGEVASARLLVHAGVPGPDAAASVIVDVTVGLATQLAFTFAGLGLLAAGHPGAALVRTVWIAAAVGVPVVLVLAAVQRAALFSRLARLARAIAGRRLEALASGAPRLDAAIDGIYRRRGRLLRCAAWQLAGWAAGAGEVWIFLRFQGAPVGIGDALAIEAVVQAASSAGFLVPAALGVQEGAFLAAGTAVGLLPGAALALALARRAREVLLFVPALVAWQAGEGRRLLEAREG
jgi:putative membrane protein